MLAALRHFISNHSINIHLQGFNIFRSFAARKELKGSISNHARVSGRDMYFLCSNVYIGFKLHRLRATRGIEAGSVEQRLYDVPRLPMKYGGFSIPLISLEIGLGQ